MYREYEANRPFAILLSTPWAFKITSTVSSAIWKAPSEELVRLKLANPYVVNIGTGALEQTGFSQRAQIGWCTVLLDAWSVCRVDDLLPGL